MLLSRKERVPPVPKINLFSIYFCLYGAGFLLISPIILNHLEMKYNNKKKNLRSTQRTEIVCIKE